MILYYMLGWQMIPTYKRSGNLPTTRITVVVPARDEEDNIGNLLQALKEQDYPKDLYEVIVVNDHSEDLTPELVLNFDMEHVYLINLADHVEPGEIAFKKRAVETAVDQASGELIVTTDADCVMGPEWLSTMACFYEEKEPVFIVAPVDYSPLPNTLSKLEALDFMSIMGVTAATVYHRLYSLSNGANMAYPKRIFQECSGYEGIDQSPSGDDVFLIEKIGAQYPDRIHYLKSKAAIVSTAPCGKLSALFSQRMRWISKTKLYKDKRTKLTASLVFFFYLTVFANVVLSIYKPIFFNLLLVQFLVKLLVDFAFADEIAAFFKKRRTLWYFLAFEILHYPFILLVGICSQLFKYRWKERTIKS